MKAIATLFICCIASFGSAAADKALIPAPLNEVIAQIKPGMKRAQVVAILSSTYPGVQLLRGLWSGGSGFVYYRLTQRFDFAVKFIGEAEASQVVHNDWQYIIVDNEEKQRIDIRMSKADTLSEVDTQLRLVPDPVLR